MFEKGCIQAALYSNKLLISDYTLCKLEPIVLPVGTTEAMTTASMTRLDAFSRTNMLDLENVRQLLHGNIMPAELENNIPGDILRKQVVS